MRALVLGLWLVGCGGDKNAADTGSDTDAISSTPGEQCEGIPEYDLDGLGCDQVRDAFDTMTGAADRCDADADCLLLTPGSCGLACEYVVNDCLETGDLAEYITKANSCAEQQGCTCGTAPEPRCVERRCELVYADR